MGSETEGVLTVAKKPGIAGLFLVHKWSRLRSGILRLTGMPAVTDIQKVARFLDPRLRANDDYVVIQSTLRRG